MWGLRKQIDDLRKQEVVLQRENLQLRLVLLRVEGLLKQSRLAEAKAEIRKVLTNSN